MRLSAFPGETDEHRPGGRATTKRTGRSGRRPWHVRTPATNCCSRPRGACARSQPSPARRSGWRATEQRERPRRAPLRRHHQQAVPAARRSSRRRAWRPPPPARPAQRRFTVACPSPNALATCPTQPLRDAPQLIALLVIYLVAFVVANTERVEVSFVMFDAQHPLILRVMLVSFIIGAAFSIAATALLPARRAPRTPACAGRVAAPLVDHAPPVRRPARPQPGRRRAGRSQLRSRGPCPSAGRGREAHLVAAAVGVTEHALDQPTRASAAVRPSASRVDAEEAQPPGGRRPRAHVARRGQPMAVEQAATSASRRSRSTSADASSVDACRAGGGSRAPACASCAARRSRWPAPAAGAHRCRSSGAADAHLQPRPGEPSRTGHARLRSRPIPSFGSSALETELPYISSFPSALGIARRAGPRSLHHLARIVTQAQVLEVRDDVGVPGLIPSANTYRASTSVPSVFRRTPCTVAPSRSSDRSCD